MRLLLALFTELFAWDHTVSQTYSNDPKTVVFKQYKSDDVVIHKNAEWVDRVTHNKNQLEFINSMINIPETIPLTPDAAFSIMDESPFCWVVLAYNSNHLEFYKETKELGNAISEHFFQRCGVAILDVGYPSNFATFGDLVEEVPALIIKNPKQIHKLFHHKDINAEMIHFHHQDIKEWGQIVEHRELVQDPGAVFHKIDSIYKDLHETYKIGAVFMNHYNQTAEDEKTEVSKRRGYYRAIYNNLVKGMQKDVLKQAKKIGLQPSMNDEDLKEASESVRIENDKRLYKFIMNEMAKALDSIEMMNTIEEEYEKVAIKVKEEYEGYDHLLDPVLDPKIEIVPPTPLEIESKIPNWLKLKEEL